jgi:cleavage stimulation factor subunit 3
MADDAEKAFFEAQAQTAETEGFEAAAEQAATSDSDDEYDPMQTIHDQYSAPAADSQPAGTTSASNLYPPSSLDKPEQILGAVLRAQSSTETETPTPTVETPLPSLQPTSLESHGHTEAEEAGEEDGGEAEYEPPAALSHVQDLATSVSADVPQRSVSQNMNETVSSFDVSQQLQPTVPDKITPHDVLPTSSSSSVPASSNVGIASHPKDVPNGAQPQPQSWSQMPSAEPGKSPTPAATATTTPAAPRGRLPHDRVGILEDRIQVDPRGDTDAWLELINEHRSRNKIENARQVYERFLKVFPTAVSIILHHRQIHFGGKRTDDGLLAGRTMDRLCQHGVGPQ